MSDILVAIGDMFFGSKVDAAAKQLGVAIQKAKKTAPLVEEVKRTGARRVLLDLANPTLGGPNAVKAIAQDPTLKHVEIVGYCRHTSVELIRSAKEAGCHRVMTQGEFSSALPELLTTVNTADVVSAPPACEQGEGAG
ncbi:MAG: hypothetical protein AB2A00_08050 [Myxococcota bacterium]